MGDVAATLPKWRVFLAGASAGLSVDVLLFPIDTIKSRLQSKPGFFASGGFKQLYRGLGPVLASSVPNAALFFLTYETSKQKLDGHCKNVALRHVVSATLGEVVSSSVRVPCEILKIRSQTNQAKSVIDTLGQILRHEGPTGLFRGFASTVARDVPFAMIQYPIWEALKRRHERSHGDAPSPRRSAALGSIAGALAAFTTTPLDVAKSRIMLADRSETLASGSVFTALKQIATEKGVPGLFAGVMPRVAWISAGAFVFLGAYEKATAVLGSS